MGELTQWPEEVWRQAWSWVQRQHETLDLPPDDLAALAAWLAVSPSHRAAYAHASQIWLLAGLVPPVHDMPGDDNADGDAAGG